MLKIRKTADKIEILEGGESLPEGEVVTLVSLEKFKRMMGLIDRKTNEPPKKPAPSK